MGLFGNTTKEDEEPQDSTPKDVETYSYTRECDNCGDEGEYEIPKGTTIEEFFKDEECEECGCKLSQETEEEAE